MQSGIYWGYVGMIEGLVARIQAEYGGGLKAVSYTHLTLPTSDLV